MSLQFNKKLLLENKPYVFDKMFSVYIEMRLKESSFILIQRLVRCILYDTGQWFPLAV